MNINFTPNLYVNYNKTAKNIAFSAAEEDSPWLREEKTRIMQKYSEKIEHLDDLVDAGFINEDTYIKELAKLKKDRAESIEYLDKSVEDFDKATLDFKA